MAQVEDGEGVRDRRPSLSPSVLAQRVLAEAAATCVFALDCVQRREEWRAEAIRMRRGLGCMVQDARAMRAGQTTAAVGI